MPSCRSSKFELQMVTAKPVRTDFGDLAWLNLVSSGCVLDGADGGAGVVVEGCAGVEDVVAGLDGDAAVAAQGLHEFLDRPAGLAFEPVADGEGGHHDCEVGLDGVALVVVDRPGS